MTQNQLAYHRDMETRRSNLAKEHLENLKRSNELYAAIENVRHNKRMESLASSQEKRASAEHGFNMTMNFLRSLFGNEGRSETAKTVNNIMGFIGAGSKK